MAGAFVNLGANADNLNQGVQQAARNIFNYSRLFIRRSIIISAGNRNSEWAERIYITDVRFFIKQKTAVTSAT